MFQALAGSNQNNTVCHVTLMHTRRVHIWAGGGEVDDNRGCESNTPPSCFFLRVSKNRTEQHSTEQNRTELSRLFRTERNRVLRGLGCVNCDRGEVPQPLVQSPLSHRRCGPPLPFPARTQASLLSRHAHGHNMACTTPLWHLFSQVCADGCCSVLRVQRGDKYVPLHAHSSPLCEHIPWDTPHSPQRRLRMYVYLC